MEHYELLAPGRDVGAGRADTHTDINLNDRLYVELQLISRRLRRMDQLIGRAAVQDPADTPWTDIRTRCAEALGSIIAAAGSVPDADPEITLAPRPLQVRDLRLDPHARRVWFLGAELNLTRLEFGLLGTLALNPTQVRTKAELFETVWGFSVMPRTRTVDSHASRLRTKLGYAGASPREWVVNHPGVGYALVRPDEGRDANGGNRANGIPR